MSLRRWSAIAARIYRLLRSSQVPLKIKLLLSGWFASYAERNYLQL